ncbi:ADP-ribosyl cyclase/cyclic ADP-ribose hydrolase 1-like isoform X2 [Trichomycterus rosablanca]|uniref:ADP-ribosyl cyclase/cyclic ADP-ribose hydrolase 1-like isoform X2 n=1 Tax=Trichomycterus rosablanca TaxID=2290929 RepID=UPI002F360625
MAYEVVNNRSRKTKRKLFGLVGTAVLVLGVVLVLVVVLLVKNGNGNANSVRKTVIARCESYLKEHSSIARLNECEKIWGAFEKAYVGRDACDVPLEAYDPLIKTVTQQITCNTLFWSKTNAIAHAFTKSRNCLLTVEDTLLGFIFNGLTWCSKNDSKETLTTHCPEWSYCQNNPVRSFWIQASRHFAVTACGHVFAMLNGSLEAPFSTSSVFGSVEVKSFNSSKVDSLTVLLVTKDTDNTTCSSPSFKDLRNALASEIVYNCTEVPYSSVERCISHPEIQCSDCLSRPGVFSTQ